MKKIMMALGVSAIALGGTATSAHSAARSDSLKDSVKSAEDKQSKKQADSPEEDIVVVGSRIRRGTKNVSEQVQVIKVQDGERTGRATVRDILQSTAITGGGDQNIAMYNALSLSNGGPGVANLSLRLMGPTRTLILLNGRRLAPAGTSGTVSAADLNTVPTAIVDQIQILKDGASSIYGSDAMAGVVDILTRRRVQGVEFSSVTNMTEHGGGNLYRLSTVAGMSGDRFNISFGFDFNHNEELEFGDRARYDCPTNYRIDLEAKNPVPGSADVKDPKTGKPLCWYWGSGGVTQNMIMTPSIEGRGYDNKPFFFNMWKLNPNITEGPMPGLEGINPSDGNYDIYGDNVEAAEAYANTYYLPRMDFYGPGRLSRSILGRTRMYIGLLSLSYDLQKWGDAEIYADFLGSRRSYFQDFPHVTEILYVVHSPMLPEIWADEEMSQFTPTEYTNWELPIIRVRRADEPWREWVNNKFWRASVGMRGDTGISDWRYDFTYTWSRSDASQTRPVERTSHLTYSHNVVKIGDQFFCADEKARADGCVPIPEYSINLLKPNGVPKAWLDYIRHNMRSRTIYNDSTLNMDFNGNLKALPYGMAKAAFGGEMRFNSINDQPDPLRYNQDIYEMTVQKPTIGKGRAYDVYGELEVPLLADLKFAKVLSLNASARLTNNQYYKSNTTYKAGILYTPANWLSLRASYGTSYRAPALYEHFLGETISTYVETRYDPCANWTRYAEGTPIYNNCKSEGLSEGHMALFPLRELIDRGSHNKNLKGESARNISIGMAFQPYLDSRFGDLLFTADFYLLDIRDTIEHHSAIEVMNLCYNDPLFRNGSYWCTLVGERASKEYMQQIPTVITEFMNRSRTLTKGLDFKLNYARELGLGDINLTSTVNYIIGNKSRLTADSPYVDYTGTLTRPRASGTFAASYKIKRWVFGYDMEWIASCSDLDYYMKYLKLTEVPPSLKARVLETPNYYMHSISISYQSDTWRASFAVRNLQDIYPPRISAGMRSSDDRLGDSMYYSGYDFLGRTFSLSLNKKF